MKKFQIIFALLAFAGLASSQETYSVAIVAPANVNKIDLGRAQSNAAACTRFGLLGTCTQAQVCVAAAVTGGASCTAADAIAAGVRIYPATLSGREAFVTNELVRFKLQDFAIRQAQLSVASLTTFCATANQTQQDAVCTSSGQSAGCGLCDAFR